MRRFSYHFCLTLLIISWGCSQIQEIRDAYFPSTPLTTDTLAVMDTLPLVPVDSSQYYLQELPTAWKEVWAYGGEYAFLKDCEGRVPMLTWQLDSTGKELAYFTKYALDTFTVAIRKVSKIMGSKMDFYASDVNYHFEVGNGEPDSTFTWKLQIDTMATSVSWFFGDDDELHGNYTSMLPSQYFDQYLTLFSGPCLPNSCIPNPDSTLMECPTADSLLIGKGVAKMLVVQGGIYQFYESSTTAEPIKVLKLDANKQPREDMSWLEPLERELENDRLYFACFQEQNNRLEILSSESPYQRLWVDQVMLEELTLWQGYWQQEGIIQHKNVEGKLNITVEPDTASQKVDLSADCLKVTAINGDWLMVEGDPEQCGKYAKKGRRRPKVPKGYLRWKEEGELLLKIIMKDTTHTPIGNI